MNALDEVEKGQTTMDEKNASVDSINVYGHLGDGSTSTSHGRYGKITALLLDLGVESRGILPVPPAQRTDPQFHKVFFLFLSANLNILSFSAGTLGPLVYGLSLRDSALVILWFNVIGCALPAYFATFGPKLGLRQLVQARYTFGHWGTIVPACLNMIGMFGFMVLNCILGGETLSSASVFLHEDGTQAGGGISWDVGIVIVAIVSLFVSFCGYKVLNVYERYAWIPVLIIYVIALGVSGSHLTSSPPVAIPPATARQILSFASTVAGFVISYCPLSSDFTTYMRRDVSSYKVCMYTFLGLFLPTTLVQILGAAFAASLSSNPSWQTSYDENSLAGLLHRMLLPAGAGFSRFLLVLLAFSVTANVAPTLYSFSLSAQTALPFNFILRLPRFLFSVLATAILIPVAIVGSTRFYDTLVNFLGLIGYWAACFGAAVLTEHVVFRHGRFANYNVDNWDRAKYLPSGAAALMSSAIGIGIAVLCMDQVWFVGPVARTTGDIGFEVSFFVTTLAYLVLRPMERKVFGDRG